MTMKKTLVTAFFTAVLFGAQGCSPTAETASMMDDPMLKKFADWHLGFTTNAAQRDADLDAKVEPRWGLSELRFQQIWESRDDGYWVYYETSQPDVRPDRNQIWRLYRNDAGSLKVDAYNFKDLKQGLEFWGKGADPTVFAGVSLDDLETIEGCNGAYTWRPDFERFIGVNPHRECITIGQSYLLQHVEISKLDDGTLVRNDWHTFYDKDGVSKRGAMYKSGTYGPTIHLYTERYPLK